MKNSLLSLSLLGTILAGLSASAQNRPVPGGRPNGPSRTTPGLNSSANRNTPPTSTVPPAPIGAANAADVPSDTPPTPPNIVTPPSNSANNSPANAATTAPTQPNLKLGDYVDLDDAIRNDMYGTIDFPNAELKDIIKAISKMANKNFILDRKIENRRITIISPQAVTKQEAYNAFLSSLYMNDLTVVSMGRFLKIVETKNALQSNIRVFVGDYAPASEEVITLIYPLKYLNADEIQRFLTDLVPRNGRINSYPNTNSLVMTDTGLNLRRIVSILKSIDIPGHEDQLENIPIHYASAKGIAQLIDDILDAQSGRSRTGGPSGRNQPQKTRGGGIITKIVPDERTNSLVVLANGRGVQELKNLVNKLDTQDASGGGNIHIYFCKNAVAEELAATINSLVSGQKPTTPGGPGGGINPPGVNPAPRNSGGGEGVKFEGNLKVTADKATNSLVIVASGSDYAALKTVLRKLDIPRRQVYVEATIMELMVDDKNQFMAGVNISAPGVGQAAGFAPSGFGDDVVKAITTPAGLAGVVAGFQAGNPINITNPLTGTTIKGISTVNGLIRALEDTGQAQILHQPQILTSDNQDAEIKVSTKVPTASQSQTSGVGGAVATTTASKETIEISLKITPQIGTDNDLVKLKVEQSVDDFSKVNLESLKDQIQTTNRKATTTVVVRDTDTVVVGGLNKVSTQDARSKFPLLGDLPIIGWLFKSSQSEETRSSLILFLTPHIINKYEDLLKLTGDKIDAREKFGKDQYDPKDRLAKNIKELKETNAKDRAKPPPKGWGFKTKTDVENEPQDEVQDSDDKASDQSASATDAAASKDSKQSTSAYIQSLDDDSQNGTGTGSSPGATSKNRNSSPPPALKNDSSNFEAPNAREEAPALGR